jgi:predicted HAD superfamily phosphohydrolase YqeG
VVKAVSSSGVKRSKVIDFDEEVVCKRSKKAVESSSLVASDAGMGGASSAETSNKAEKKIKRIAKNLFGYILK